MLPLRKIGESPRQLRIRVETLAVIDGTERRELLPRQRDLRLIGFCIMTEESIMQSRTKNEAKRKTKERLGKPMKDPTLEGKDLNKVGRVQEKIGTVDWESLRNGISRGKTVIKCGMGHNVFQQGQPADSLFYIRRGKVKLKVTSQQGKEAIVAILDAGSFFGEGCLAGQPLRMATAVAMTDCTLDQIEKSLMVRMLHEQQDISELFITHLLSRDTRYNWNDRDPAK
jgi:hypothetical protein